MEQSAEQVGQAEKSGPTLYRGVGGWLLFFIVSLTILTPAFHGYIVYSEWALYNTNPSQLLFELLALDWSMRAVLIAMGIYAGIQLLRVKTGAPRTAKAYLLAVCAQQTVLVFVGMWTLSKIAADPHSMADVVIQPLRSFLYVAIWYRYLDKSQRVAATYPAVSLSSP